MVRAMSVEQLIWDGTSPTRSDPTVYKRPDGADWNMITKQLQVCQASAYSQLVLTAGQYMPSGTPFYIGNDGKIYPTDHISFPEAAGFTTQSGVGALSVTTNGKVTVPGWGLAAGGVYFLNGVGLISTSVPTTGYIVEVGRALSSDTLDVKINSPVRL